MGDLTVPFLPTEQVVPHEVMGMSNFNKNLFIGLGGKDAIDLSHFIGACYGMEKMMGKADNPLRRILNQAADDFLKKLPLVCVPRNFIVQTVAHFKHSVRENDRFRYVTNLAPLFPCCAEGLCVNRCGTRWKQWRTGASGAVRWR